jgi:hypothetical protein
MNSIKNSPTHFRPLRKVLFCALCFTLLAVAGCNKSANQAGTQPTQANANQAKQDEARNIMPTVDANVAQPVDDPTKQGSLPDTSANGGKENYAQMSQEELMVGIWRYQVQSNGYVCQGEDIYQGNGSYSTQWNCGGSLTWQTGNWYLLQPGVVRREIKNYEPKEFRGVPVRMINAETFQFRFLDYNHMQYANGVVLYRQ